MKQRKKKFSFFFQNVSQIFCWQQSFCIMWWWAFKMCNFVKNTILSIPIYNFYCVRFSAQPSSQNLTKQQDFSITSLSDRELFSSSLYNHKNYKFCNFCFKQFYFFHMSADTILMRWNIGWDCLFIWGIFLSDIHYQYLFFVHQSWSLKC